MALGPDLADDEDEAEFLHIVFEDSSEIPRNRWRDRFHVSPTRVFDYLSRWKSVCRLTSMRAQSQALLGSAVEIWDLSKQQSFVRSLYTPPSHTCGYNIVNSRRKFRSQTSDNMDRWKAEVEQKHGEKKSRREKIREEKESEEKKIQVREKVGKSQNTVFFQWFVAAEGRKVGSLKRRVRSQLARWEMKNCTPLWCEEHLQVKKLKTPHVRSTFGRWDVEKVHAVVARSTFPSQNVQSTPCSDHFWKLRCRKSARRCRREAHFEVKMLETPHACATFGRSDVVSRGRRKGLCTLSKVSKTWGFCSISKNDGRRGTFEEDLQRCIFRGRRSTRDMFIRAVRRSGRWFPERGCILEHQIFRFAEMILRDRCSTSYDLASLFRGRRSNLDKWGGKIAKRIGTRPSALHSTFYFWRKSRRMASFLMLSTSKNEEVSKNCFVFDVVKFKNWGCLAELLRFWCCQVQKLRKSRRIAVFLMLSSSKAEEVSQNSFVFKLADRQIDRQTDRQRDREREMDGWMDR